MMADSVLEIQVIREDQACPVIRLEGELDVNTAPELKKTIAALAEEGFQSLVVDMERLYFLDSAALGALIGARNRVGNGLRIQNPSPTILRVLQSTGVARLFEISDREEEQQQLLNFGLEIEDTTAGIPVVRLRGELDAFSTSHFRGGLISLAQEGHRFIILHLGELEFVDSVGLGGMVSVYTRLKKAGGGLFLAEPSEQIAKVLRITGLEALFPLHETCADAVAAAEAARGNMA